MYMISNINSGKRTMVLDSSMHLLLYHFLIRLFDFLSFAPRIKTSCFLFRYISRVFLLFRSLVRSMPLITCTVCSWILISFFNLTVCISKICATLLPLLSWLFFFLLFFFLSLVYNVRIAIGIVSCSQTLANILSTVQLARLIMPAN